MQEESNNPKTSKNKEKTFSLTKSWDVGKICGIPLKLHWSLPMPILILVPLQTAQAGWPTGGMALLTIPLAMLVVTLHELGHCLTAKLFQMETKSITLTGIGGIASIPGKEPPCPKENLLITIAGPAVNVLILILMLSSLGIPSEKAIIALGENPFGSTYHIYTILFIINTVLLLFNLLPVYPMDGGRILKEISEIFLGKKAAGFLTLTTCLAIGIPTALLLANQKIVTGSIIIAAMSLLGTLEGLTILQKERKKPKQQPEENPPQN